MDYEKQIADEYELVLCNRLYKDKLHRFAEKYGDFTEVCIGFEEFIKETGTNKLGVPMFVAHGNEVDPNAIINELKTIPKKKMFGIETYYYVISLPIIDKEKLVTVFTKEISKKERLYASSRK